MERKSVPIPNWLLAGLNDIRENTDQWRSAMSEYAGGGSCATSDAALLSFLACVGYNQVANKVDRKIRPERGWVYTSEFGTYLCLAANESDKRHFVGVLVDMYALAEDIFPYRHVELSPQVFFSHDGPFGLKHASVADCLRPTTVSCTEISSKVGQVDEETMRQVEKKLRSAFGWD